MRTRSELCWPETSTKHIIGQEYIDKNALEYPELWIAGSEFVLCLKSYWGCIRETCVMLCLWYIFVCISAMRTPNKYNTTMSKNSCYKYKQIIFYHNKYKIISIWTKSCIHTESRTYTTNKPIYYPRGLCSYNFTHMLERMNVRGGCDDTPRTHTITHIRTQTDGTRN